MVAAKQIEPESTAANANTVELVRSFAKTQPSTRAFVDMKSKRTRTFAEFARDLDDVSACLRANNVKPGDRVALFIATGIELTTSMFACFQVGAVPVLIDPGMGVERMLGCIREQQPSALIGIPKAHVLRVAKSASFKSVRANFVVDGWFPAAVSVSSTKASANDIDRVHRAKPDDVAAVLYTSGSTGAPKGVVYTHAMFGAQAHAIRDMFDIKPGEVDVACFLPFGFFSVSMGMTAVFPDMDFRFPAKADAHKILAALVDNQAQSAFASPALWEPFSRFLESEKARGNNVQLHGLKRVLTAGAPVRPTLHERLLAHLPDGDVYTPYGATEALPVAFMNGRGVVDETAALTRAGRGTCVGKLAPKVEVRIIAVTDAPIATMREAQVVPAGTIGEIVVRGPCITRAYDRNDDANAKSKIVDGDTVWHRMGDCGHFDDDGRLWFCGRKAHRVEKANVTLHSVPVEAVVEANVSVCHRAALVGVGLRGQQRAIVVLELLHRVRFSREQTLAHIRTLPGCGDVDDVLRWTGPFPVDRRHNAKIEREQLAEWAASRIGSAR